jgi:hypothetical protein
LIRDVKHLLELPAAATRAYGEKLLSELRLLFYIIHQRDELGATAFRTQLEEARERILCVATTAVPEAKETRNMARRFELHGAAYFVSVPPTPSSNSLKDR